VHAETIELLNDKGRFTSEQAVTLATAIDMGIERAQLVTVPVMDARFAAVDARFAAVDARFVKLEAKMDGGFASMNARIDSLGASMDVRFVEMRTDLKMQRWTLRLIIAMLIGQTALGPVGAQAVSHLRQALSTLVR
jgi:hypothetical protein